MARLTIVMDGQYGSCGKGHATGYLAANVPEAQTVAVRVGGSNAGHTTVDDAGVKWSLRQVPVTAVRDRRALLVLGAGSEIDLNVLEEEIRKLSSNGYHAGSQLIVDRAAVIIEDKHKLAESAAGLTVNSGSSTGKGVGAARADRAMRKARLVGQDEQVVRRLQALGASVNNTGAFLNSLAREPMTEVMVEGIQGHGLSVYNVDAYPKVTSAGTDAVDLAAMARINPWAGWSRSRVVVVMRTRPIRIAGDSGPLENETTWEALGLEPEITTVTKRVRRVGEWDPELAGSAARFNGGPNTKIWLSMLDQMFSETAGVTRWVDLSREAQQFIEQVENQTGLDVGWAGTGPETVVKVG